MSKNTVKPSLTRTGARRAAARRRAWAVRLTFRFVSGRPLNGRRCSNSTFWRRGTRRVGYPSYLITWDWWNLAAGWQRLAVRLAGVLVTVLAVLLVWAVVTP
jgi:hypothetical protein